LYTYTKTPHLPHDGGYVVFSPLFSAYIMFLAFQFLHGATETVRLDSDRLGRKRAARTISRVWCVRCGGRYWN